MLVDSHCWLSPFWPTGMKNSIARSRPSGRGRNDTSRYRLLAPFVDVQYTTFSATAGSPPMGTASPMIGAHRVRGGGR
jgi:hypothetical protein